jgi:UDP-N-acetyl-D-mannosaminuronic acid dehydrogenase
MNPPFETISIVGLGYIGLPTAAVFASRKVKVIGVDVNQHAVDTINRGQIHIIEPDLDMVVHAAVSEGYLRATTRPEPADAFLIAVPTPFKEGPTGPHHPDMDYIESASKSVAEVLKVGDLVILESTSPVGATEQMAAWLAEARPDLTFPHTHGESSDIRIAHCPERVLPGRVLQELVQNDRVIGGLTPKCSQAAVRLYKVFVQGDCVITNSRTAEMCKLTENSFRDVNIAFANELSIICEKQGIDVWELIRLANRHPRVKILQPGPGVGGHCIAVDPWFIVSSNPEDAKIIKLARDVNEEKPNWIISKVKKSIESFLEKASGCSPEALTISFFGLTFKANIDDLRESPSLAIAIHIANEVKGSLLIIEPNISDLPKELAGRARLVGVEEGLKNSDIVVMLVAHEEFSHISLADIQNKTVIDACGVFGLKIAG